MRSSRTFASISIASALVLAGCSNGGGSALPLSQQVAQPSAKAGSSPITHVIVIVQENRSFDNLFATFPGADGATSGNSATVQANAGDAQEAKTRRALDINHDYTTFLADYDDGKMDCFNQRGINGNNPAGTYPYQYVDPATDPAVLDAGPAIRARRPHVPDAGQRQFHRPPRSHRRRTTGTIGSSTGSLIDYPSNW